MTDGAARIIVLEGSYDTDLLEQTLRVGQTAFFEDDPTAFVRTESGDIDELTPEEHDDYIEIGATHGVPQMPDEPDIDDNDCLNSWLGKIGHLYFEKVHDPREWNWCGPLAPDDEAIAYVCGADFTFRRS